ncbi:MAG: methionine synthase [Mycobacteriales bacterium]
MSQPLPWPAGTATGVGSLPGVDVREALELVFDLLPDLPHLPELPARGPGADLLGRSAALLADLPVDLQPAGWRLVDRPGIDLRRSQDYLARDLDALAERAEGYEGAIKLQVAGPWTLAAGLELPRGGPVLRDPGAVRELAESLAAGLASHVAEVGSLVPGAKVVVQLDEPGLPAVLAGAVPSASGFGRAPVPERSQVTERLAMILAAAGPCGGVHCCAPRPPVDLLVAAGARWLGLDVALLVPGDDDSLGSAVEAGVALFLGVLPATDPDAGAEVSDVVANVRSVRALWSRWGFPSEVLASSVVLTPACGLAGTSPGYARRVLRQCREAARYLLEESG